jgi:hypothetical protein
MAEIFRGKVLARPLNEGRAGTRQSDLGELFWRCMDVIELALDRRAMREGNPLGAVLDRTYTGAVLDMTLSANKLGVLGDAIDWRPVLEWLEMRLDTATATEEAR